MSKTMILKPVLSEKAYGLSANRRYIFEAPKAASKQSIKQAVESRYKVAVISVRVANANGKSKSVWRRGKRIAGQTQDAKRAYVYLGEGHRLPFFEEQHDHDHHDHDHDHKADKKEKK